LELKEDESENEALISDWETPTFAQIKKKKTKRLSPYLESEIWDRDDILKKLLVSDSPLCLTYVRVT
jgi:hypothetical protein